VPDVGRRAAIIAAARECLGARFRPHGRDRRWGLDCVGVAACAFGRHAPADYPLRGGQVEQVMRAVAATGFIPIDADAAQGGDLLLMAGVAGQLHLGVLTDAGVVHADAGLRRVVERPGAPPLPVIAAWSEE
jgi:murein DD-endopeptidase / murein LD-carboxypeptidase